MRELLGGHCGCVQPALGTLTSEGEQDSCLRVCLDSLSDHADAERSGHVENCFEDRSVSVAGLAEVSDERAVDFQRVDGEAS